MHLSITICIGMAASLLFACIDQSVNSQDCTYRRSRILDYEHPTLNQPNFFVHDSDQVQAQTSVTPPMRYTSVVPAQRPQLACMPRGAMNHLLTYHPRLLAIQREALTAVPSASAEVPAPEAAGIRVLAAPAHTRRSPFTTSDLPPLAALLLLGDPASHGCKILHSEHGVSTKRSSICAGWGRAVLTGPGCGSAAGEHQTRTLLRCEVRIRRMTVSGVASDRTSAPDSSSAVRSCRRSSF